MAVSFDGFDVDAYAAKYSGRNRINRLLFLAKTSDVLRHDAHEALLRDLKTGLNMKLYLEVAEAAASASEDVPESVLNVDHAHVETVKLSAVQQHERLEQELNSYKSTMIKESIRMGYNDLGDFYYQLGDLPAALKSYAQARDYCTADKHIIEMCLNVIKAGVGLHMQNYSHVKSYLMKLEQVATSQNDPILKSKISSAFGLVALHEKNYREAAHRFTECQAEIGATYNEVLHAEDIALYGGICALATFRREELKDKVINNTSFKAFLELLPWLRELINDFYASNYAICLQSLEKAKPEMRVDLYLSDHVTTLCHEIRSRGIVQFFHPYLSVDLHQMAKTFNTATENLEQEICVLIAAGKIEARLDSYQKILHAYHPNKRNATYKRAFDVGRKYAAESKNLMLRMSLLKNNLVIRDVYQVIPRNRFASEPVLNEWAHDRKDDMDPQHALENQAEDALAFSASDVAKAQNELGVYSSASRAILLHLCQRIGRLEVAFRTMQTDFVRIRTDLSKGNNEMKDEVSGIQGQVQTLSSRLHDVASVVDLFQSEMNNHRTQVSSLSTSVQDEKERLSAVDVKVDNQRDEFDTRFQELNLKLDEIPRALAALQKTSERDPFADFTFRAAERDKLSLGKHVDRTEAGQRNGGPPFTDLQPFTIPDDMKEKIELKIRQREASKSVSDKRAAAELADAYRRLQLAGYPRVTEIHMHVEQCREEIKRAFDFIRNSNLQLYACCESKVERVDLVSLQNELKALRNRVRDFETRSVVGKKPQVPPSPTPALPNSNGHVLSAWSLDKYFNQPLDKPSANNSGVRVSAAQVPELRVSLLEMAKTLHGLRQQWAKKHVQPLNPIVKQHLDKLIAVLNDGYSVTAEEPVDLERIEVHVEKTARLLGSEFTQQVIRMMMLTDHRHDGSGTDDIASALDRYARSFTEAAGGAGAATGGGGNALPAAQHAATMRAINDQKKKVEQLRAELEKVVESQRSVEATLAVPPNATAIGVLPTPASTEDTPSAVDVRFATHQQQLYGLQDQLTLLHRQTRQQEEAFAEMARQFGQWRKERAPIGIITGQRVAGAPPAPHAVQYGMPLSAALRRSNSGNANTDLDAYLAITAVEQGDRPKSQTKLDPLHVQRSAVASGETKAAGRNTLSVPVPVARNGVVHKIQSRAQGMRPKSGVHQGGADTNSTT